MARGNPGLFSFKTLKLLSRFERAVRDGKVRDPAEEEFGLQSPYVSPGGKNAYPMFDNNVSIPTLMEHDYDRMISSDDSWAGLSAEMDRFYEDSLDMFPFEEEREETDDTRLNWIEAWMRNGMNWVKRNIADPYELTRLGFPKRFFQIQSAIIEKRFPGGRGTGMPGDGDIRDLISDFRELFRFNLAKYIARKRRLQQRYFNSYHRIITVATVLYFTAYGTSLFAVYPEYPAAFYGTVVTALLLYGAALILPRHWLIHGDKQFKAQSKVEFDYYSNSQIQSCRTLDKQVGFRTKNLSNLIDILTARIDKDGRTQHQSDWPERCRRWVKLVYWLSQRQETIERYAQLEFWRVRRIHAQYIIAGNIRNYQVRMKCVRQMLMTGAFAIACAGGLGYATMQIVSGNLGKYVMLDLVKGVAANLVLIGCNAAVVVAGFAIMYGFMSQLYKLSSENWNTELDILKDNIDVKNWDRYQSVRLHDKLAEQVANDKRQLQKFEDMLKK